MSTIQQTLKKIAIFSLLPLTLSANTRVDTNFDDVFKLAQTKANINENILELAQIAMNLDEENNLNPSLFIPIYYGNSDKFYSAISYVASNSSSTEKVYGFKDSKSAFMSNTKSLVLNYISYKSSIFNLKFSVGVESTLSYIENNEFGYIHDSANIFNQGTDYYISFDNIVELNLKKHAIRADIELPFGSYINSKLSASLSPYSTVGVKQKTIFKPLSNDTGSSSSTTIQELAYNVKYELQTDFDMFIDIGLSVAFNNQPLKYDVAVLYDKDNVYSFQTQTIDIDETKKSYMAKIFFDISVMGGLKPFIGYGREKLTKKDGFETVSIDTTLYSFGFESRF